MLQQAQRRQRFLHPPPAARSRRRQHLDSLSEESESDALDVHELARQEQQTRHSNSRLRSRKLPRATARNVRADPSHALVTTSKQARLSTSRHTSTSGSRSNSAMDADHEDDLQRQHAPRATDAAAVVATTTTTTKRATATGSTAASPRVLSVTLTVGDWLDVLDYVGVWNVAQVLNIPSPDAVEVRYDGWGAQYNEVVSLNSNRVAPYHTYTWTVKCWAKYKNWPMWPAIMTVRAPGTDEGYRNLCTVKRVYVDFVDSKTFALRCRCWVPKTDVVPFNEHFDRLRKRTTGANFESSLKHVLQATASTKFPTFVRGTLPKQFETSLATSVKKMKRVMGTTMWLKDFANNRERHSRMHGSSSSSSDADRNDEASAKAEVLALLAMQEAVAAQRRVQKPHQSPRSKPSQSPRTPTKPLSTSPSPRASPKSPRVATTAPSPSIPHVLVHNDEIIVEDDDDDTSGDRLVRRRRRRQHTRSGTLARSPRTKALVLPSSSSSDDDDDVDDESDGDAPMDASRIKTEDDRAVDPPQSPRLPVLSRVMDVVHDAFPDSPVRKRPSAARSLSLEPDDDDDASTRATALSAEVAMDSESDAYDVDVGVTTEENSEERLLPGHDDSVSASTESCDARPARLAVLELSTVAAAACHDVKTDSVRAASSSLIKLEPTPAPLPQSPADHMSPSPQASRGVMQATPLSDFAAAVALRAKRARVVAVQQEKQRLLHLRVEQARAALEALEAEEARIKTEAATAAATVAFPGLASSDDDAADSRSADRAHSSTRRTSAKRRKTWKERATGAARKRVVAAAPAHSSRVTEAAQTGANESTQAPQTSVDRDSASDESDVVPPLRRRFCMMRASTRVDASVAVAQKTRALRIRDDAPVMTAAAPNKFPEPPSLARSSPLLSDSPSHSMLRAAPASTRALSTTATVMSSTGTSSSAPHGSGVCSSSDFSIRAWFERKLS